MTSLTHYLIGRQHNPLPPMMRSRRGTPGFHGPISMTRAQFRCFRRFGWPPDGLRPGTPSISVVLPIPGDVRGLPPGTQFGRDAISAGEAVIVSHPDHPGKAVGLVPEFEYDDSDDEFEAPNWPRCRGRCTPCPRPGDRPDRVGRGRVRLAAGGAIRRRHPHHDRLGSAGVDVDDPRGMVEQLLESAGQHQVPDSAPSRALRVLENAAHVDAIIAVSAG